MTQTQADLILQIGEILSSFAAIDSEKTATLTKLIVRLAETLTTEDI